MIFDSMPSDWKKLQEYVCQAFNEMGCKAEEGKPIETVRGTVNVDVYVEDPIKTPQTIYIVECKQWRTRVPRGVVHEFRTVVADCGAHLGLIISQNGFQSGAYEAAEKTNILLHSWEQFNAYFLDRWLDSMGERLESMATILLEYIDPDFERFDFNNASDWKTIRQWQILKRKSIAYAVFVRCRPRVTVDSLPVRLIDPEKDLEQMESGDTSIFIELATPRQYVNFMVSRMDYWIEEFQKLLG